ncbi:MAG: hypothetical protein GXP24_13170 [Planctomycetes bacterium]|nr:hypothetical protein [Planctomycetota bacterium]
MLRPAKCNSTRLATGFTLLELAIASASATVLMVGLSSSLYIAAQSLDVGAGSLVESRTANSALATINRDLQSALTLSELTATSVTMSVPDRNGDNVPETIRYAWAGTAGDPLTQVYNGGTATTLAANVQSFSLAWMKRLIKGVSSRPIVLLVSGQSPDATGGLATPSATEQLRIDLMNGWGYDVTVISQQASQSEIDAELANATVVYASGEASGTTIGAKLNAATIGVVTESFANAEQLGFYSSLTALSSNRSTISIVNTSHYITSGYATGNLTVASSSQSMKWTTSTTAPDAATIAEADAATNFPSLLILDAGDLLASGANSAGRRCQLPWGEGGFDVTALNTDGLALMQRAIEWAAGAGADTVSAAGLQFEELTEAQQSSNTTSISIAVPPGYTAGDLLIAAVATDGNQSGSLSPPAGWNTVLVAAGNSSTTLGVWWKLASASESSSYDFTWSGNERAYGWIMRFTGHDPANPIHATATGEGTSSSPIAPAVTTTVDGCLILRIGGFDDDDVTNGDAGMSSHTTITAGESNNGSQSASGAAAYQMQTTAGDSGIANFTLNGSEQHRTVTIAIAPAP